MNKLQKQLSKSNLLKLFEAGRLRILPLKKAKHNNMTIEQIVKVVIPAVISGVIVIGAVIGLFVSPVIWETLKEAFWAVLGYWLGLKVIPAAGQAIAGRKSDTFSQKQDVDLSGTTAEGNQKNS